jgi:molybdopterin-containing oxidoreductase family membrane subunit
MAAVRPTAEEPLIIGHPTDEQLTDQLLGTAWNPAGDEKGWRLALTIAGLGTLILFAAVGWTLYTGIGVWGNNNTVGWAFDIINFVWWVGIGHAGTFISAILLLVEHKWRTSINRFAEGMTLFAVVQAGLFPLLHTGRPWFGYWLFPYYPSALGVWPQMKSALPWDAAAISTYATTSVLFWYLGLIPDLAAARDRAPTKLRRILYGIFSLGWRGSVKAWSHYRVAYFMLGGLAAPLVISVHSVVSMDFTTGLLPGWHATIFPPFFVAGAIFSGFAMVITLIIPSRKIFRLENVITMKHIDNLAKMVLLTGMIVSYAYLVEMFTAWYSGDEFEYYQFFVSRPSGPANVIFWIMMLCNVVSPQIFWFSWARQNTAVLMIVSLLVNLGMWAERFVIIVIGLQRDFLASAWAEYTPTIIDLSIFGGTICFFSLLFLLFLRYVPFVPVAEMKEMKAELEHEAHS